MIYIYIVCIERGTLLDPGGGIVSLEEPQRHTFHCLFDVGVCIDSGYTVLGPKDKSGLHCIGYRIEDTDAVVEAGRALGKAGSYPLCDTCTNTDDDGPLDNYKATVKGVVSELGDGTAGEPTGAPLISNVQMHDGSVGCDGEETLAPLCSTHNWDAEIASSAQANQSSSTKANQSSSFSLVLGAFALMYIHL